MLPWLKRYGRQGDAEFLKRGFQSGFRIPFRPREGGGTHGNLKSLDKNPGVAREKIAKEVALGRMAGPFAAPPWDNLRISPLGVVPKKEPGKFRLIHHLSFPKGESVNDDIDPELCSVSYTSFDRAMAVVQGTGPGALMAKADIESAFRLLPIHPECHHLLGCELDGEIYVDLCLPMGCSISCSYFEKFSSFLEWVVKKRTGSKNLVHYLDDFLCVGQASTEWCSFLLEVLKEVTTEFGVPLAPDKTVGPVTRLSFLGIEIDTVAGMTRLPEDKLTDLGRGVGEMLGRTKATVRMVQSLLGKLNSACRVIPMGRVFCRRLSTLLRGSKEGHHHVRLTREVKGDLQIWAQFLKSFNGRIIFQGKEVTNEEIQLFTDASGSVGFGAYLGGSWCAACWPAGWAERGLLKNLCFLELFPIVVAVFLWGAKLANRRVVFRCDNLGAVQALNKQSATSPEVVRLLRVLVLQCLKINLCFRAIHVPGVENVVADALSRAQWERFRQVAPEAEWWGSPMPDGLWQLGTGDLKGW